MLIQGIHITSCRAVSNAVGKFYASELPAFGILPIRLRIDIFGQDVPRLLQSDPLMDAI